MKGKVRLNKKGKALAVLLAGTVLAGSAIGAIHHFNEEPEEVRVENEVGHDDLIPLPYLSVDSSDFVVLDAGNHQYDGVLFQDAKLNIVMKMIFLVVLSFDLILIVCLVFMTMLNMLRALFLNIIFLFQYI